MPGDRGFDPFGLAKPTEYLQFDLDALNQSAAKNPSGNVIGKLKKVDNAPQARTIVVRPENYMHENYLRRLTAFLGRVDARAACKLEDMVVMMRSI